MLKRAMMLAAIGGTIAAGLIPATVVPAMAGATTEGCIASPAATVQNPPAAGSSCGFTATEQDGYAGGGAWTVTATYAGTPTTVNGVTTYSCPRGGSGGGSSASCTLTYSGAAGSAPVCVAQDSATSPIQPKDVVVVTSGGGVIAGGNTGGPNTC